MYILTQSKWIKDNKDNNYYVQDTELEKKYLDEGWRRYERSYKIKEQHKEYTVICPEFRNEANGSEPIVIIPDFIIPGRPYPVYVYLYAIDIYSRNSGKSQRSAVEETRKVFGLKTFAHTTLGRALKAFISVIKECTMTPNEEELKTTTDTGVKSTEFPTVRATEAMRKLAAKYMGSELARNGLRQVIIVCCEKARQWFFMYHHFLL